MARDFEEALGEAIRAARTAAGRRQEDVAAEARAWGLAWTAATVAAIETGRRHVSAVELLLLPFALRAPGEDDLLELADLLAGLGEVRLSADAVTDGEALALIARGDAMRSWADGTWDVPLQRGFDRAMRTISDRVRRYRRAFPKLKLRDLALAEDEAEGEAERHAGYRLGCSALDVAVAARSLWDRSLPAERDARAAPGASPQARGRVTRQLLEELAPIVRRGRGAR